jgi:hypothetical protein
MMNDGLTKTNEARSNALCGALVKTKASQTPQWIAIVPIQDCSRLMP